MKSFKSSLLNALNCIEEEPKEFEITVIARPKIRFGKVTQKSIIINAPDRFAALKIASNKYGKNKIVRIKERTNEIRTDNFKTIL